MVLTELIERNARRRPQREALVGGDLRLTYAQLAKRIELIARCLIKLGVTQGDRVLVQMSNLVPYVELYFAVPLLGAILVPLNVRLTSNELHYFISHSGAVCLVADLERAQAIEKGLTEWGEIRERVVVGGTLEGWRSYEELEPTDEVQWSPYDYSAENDIVYIYYTSGTTGLPKGAMWTHRQVIEALVNLQLDLPLNQDDTSLVAVNLSHGPSLLPVLHQLFYVGGRVILYHGPRFQPEEFADLAIREGVRTTLLVPTMLHRLLHLKGRCQNWFENFKYIKYVGAKMDVQELQLAVERIQTRLTQGYGSTETLGSATFLAPSDHNPNVPDLAKRLASAGKEYTNVRVSIMNDEGVLLPQGEFGQIVIRSDKNFAGYWRDPEATQNAFKEGWLLTGDLGYLDKNGYLYVEGRLSDMIISGGENIHPQEVEEVVATFPKIAECAVVGVPDVEWGEAVWAFVVPARGMKIEPEEVIKFCEGRMAGYKRPRRVVICRKLPKNLLGKTQKFSLREKAKRLKSKRGSF
jgi:acyl-CoA synthetase (AMP-forming)/AMP-acid ligase II